MTPSEVAAQRARQLEEHVRDMKTALRPAFKTLRQQFDAWLRDPTPGRLLAIACVFEETAPKFKTVAVAHAWMTSEIDRLRGELKA